MTHNTMIFNDQSSLEQFAVEFGQSLIPGDVVTLEGDLGAGKTTFTRALLRGISNHPTLEVPSPTFSLVQTYQTPKGEIWHFDLYRLEDTQEVFELGIEEALANGIAIIEWPQLIETYLPAHTKRLHIECGEAPHTRMIKF
ncbi:MAG: tRNA (adenosine(37)-N6)-threonylcarbamoyltransferase complex ATPase subunit type 1 TsaE [Alphaproteobacteria bacterium]|nr:tRNA (adenosine(37)-N6)-threonylcarbamoyltransferase complex ATPase subunit type 1 TsaE [Alphaproteobacteria bacterium]